MTIYHVQPRTLAEEAEMLHRQTPVAAAMDPTQPVAANLSVVAITAVPMPTPEEAHEAMHAPTATVAGIAYSALAIAHSDILKACQQLRERSNNEALECMREAREQIETAERMLNGRVWMM